MNKPTTTPVTTVTRLHPEIYAKLEQRFSKTIVTEATTPLTAAYALGIEAVLKELRNGYVVTL
jgi:hypothetical protein